MTTRQHRREALAWFRLMKAHEQGKQKEIPDVERSGYVETRGEGPRPEISPERDSPPEDRTTLILMEVVEEP